MPGLGGFPSTLGVPGAVLGQMVLLVSAQYDTSTIGSSQMRKSPDLQYLPSICLHSVALLAMMIAKY